MLMDAVQISSLDFNVKIEIRTVYNLLEQHKCLDLLDDKELILEATRALGNGDTIQLQSYYQKKTNARQLLFQKYAQTNRISSENLQLILDSITVFPLLFCFTCLFWKMRFNLFFIVCC
jgi:hypothetical protein